MKIKSHRTDRKASAGKVFTGLLVGSVVGATVGWLTAPGSGEQIRQRLSGDRMSAREKAKTAEGNVESQARALAQEVSNDVGVGESPAMGRKNTGDAGSEP